MIIIGVTGISGSGKTAVTRLMVEMGGFAIEADPIAHALMKKGQPAYNEILTAFGEDILSKDGEISRPALGKLVFEDKEKLRQLEGIIHPKVIAKTAELIAEAEQTGAYGFAIIDAPLLIEAGMHKSCHSCWLITATHETRVKRIMARDNISQEAAEKRLASRKGDEALRPYADIIIENNGDSLDELRVKVAEGLYSTPGPTGHPLLKKGAWVAPFLGTTLAPYLLKNT